jgi:mRNA-degrading endonuclease RelE of RelBE toxin-antitoxin system
MDLNSRVDNPCIERKDFCINCNSHFMKVRPSIRTVAVSRRFIKDLKDQEMADSIIKDVLDCSHLEFHELHKFEKNIDGNLIFRAKKEKAHIVYGVDKNLRIIFLRAMQNFTQYKKFLEDTKEISRMIARTHAS